MSENKGLQRMLHKKGSPVCHALNMPIDNTMREALCGVVGNNNIYFSNNRLKSMYSNKPDMVDCPSCKTHNLWEVWVLKKTSVG